MARKRAAAKQVRRRVAELPRRFGSADVFQRELDIGSRFPHGSNVFKKATDRDVLADAGKAELIKEIAARYVEWRDAACAVSFGDDDLATEAFVNEQTLLYQEYRDLLDDPRVDIFDSRGALQPSALEEFCYFLFKPLLDPYGEDLAVGHHEVYQGLYFSASNFNTFARLPTPMYPVGNLDFVIGKRITSTMETDIDSVSQDIHVPAVAVECKTYLDRPRWIESDILATNIKRGFPRCLYVLISEFLKLDLSKVNVHGSQIDRVYVFRRTQNVDRRIRRAGGTGLASFHAPAVLDFFRAVRRHLSEDWAAPDDWQATGILK